MMRPPLWIRLHFISHGGRSVSFFIPLFLLWILILPLLLVTIVIILAADLLTLFRYRISCIFFAVLGLTAHLRGFRIAVTKATGDETMKISIL